MRDVIGQLERLQQLGRSGIKEALRGQFAQDSATVLSAHLVRLVLGVVSSVLLARALGPSGLSVFAVVGAAAGIAGTFADLGLQVGAVRFIAAAVRSDLAQAERWAATFVRLKLMAGVTVAAMLWLLANPLAQLLNLPQPQGALLLRLGCLGVLATAASGTISTILHALRNFRHLFLMQTVNVALTVALMALLWATGRLTVASALVVGAVTAAAAALMGLQLLTPGWRAVLLRRIALRTAEAAQLLRFSRWLWLSTLLAMVTAQIDVLMLNFLLPLPLVGIYVLARNLAQKVGLLNHTLHTVLLPGVSALSTRSDIRRYWRRGLLRSILLIALIVMGIPLARPFIVTLYGDEFAAAVTVFYALLALVALELLLTPLFLLALPLDQPRLLAATDALQLVLLVAMGLLFIPQFELVGIVAARLLARAGSSIVVLLYVWRYVHAELPSAEQVQAE